MTTPACRRVLMTTDAVGGVWSYSASLARGLAARGCEVVLVTLGPPPHVHQRAAIAGHRIRLKVTDFALEWMDPEAKDFERALMGLAAIGEQVRPNIVHLNGYREALAAWPAPVLVVAHSCVRSWWRACRRSEPDSPRWDRYVANVADGLVAADAWIAPSRSFGDEIERLYAPPRRGRVIRNGSEPAARAGKEPFILAAGRFWDEAKNLGALVSVAPGLPWRVKLAGPETSEFGVLDTGTVSAVGDLAHAELLALMARAAIFVAPSRYEPFGLAVLEAAGARCALVLADIPAFRELWDGAAVFVDPHDHRALAAALKQLCTDGRLRRQLQAAAALRARRYRIADTIERYCAVYEELHGMPHVHAPPRKFAVSEAHA